MFSSNKWVKRFLLAFTILFLTACTNQTTPALPSATLLLPSVTSTSSATFTVTATETNTPTATATDTPTPTQTLTPTPTDTATSTSPPPTPSGADAIYIYYIQLDTGGPVGCGDTAIKVNTGQWRTGDIAQDTATALKRLFASRYQYYGNLYHALYASNISVESVSFKPFDGIISIRLLGTYVRTGDTCDNSRARAQVWSTIRQFPEVKTIDILLNGNLLGDILANDR